VSTKTDTINDALTGTFGDSLTY